MATLIYKIKITANITVLTGLHIGGSDAVLDIGGIDNSIIKTKNNIPYIPGSSLKGKLRDLIARSNGFNDIEQDRGATEILFSGSIKRTINQKTEKVIKEKTVPTRLITRDCFAIENTVDVHEKSENVIDRSTGGAMPRITERVSPDTVFEMDMILDVYDIDKGQIINLLETLQSGFQLLENDFLGGSGSRGYGKVKFSNFKLGFPFIGKGEKPGEEVEKFKFKL